MPVTVSSVTTSTGSRQTTSAALPSSLVAAILPTSRASTTDSTRQTIQQQWQFQQQPKPQPSQQHNEQKREQHRSLTSVDVTDPTRNRQLNATSTPSTTHRNVAENSSATPEIHHNSQHQQQQPQQQQQQQQLRQARQQEPTSILKTPASDLVTSRQALSRPQTLPATTNPPEGSSELNEALAELDSIASQTRQLSKSLSLPTESSNRLQVSPTPSSSRLHSGSRSPEPSSLISAVTAALDARMQGKTTVHPKLAALHETRSLDRSGVARRQLEQLINPVASTNPTAGIHKTVALRKPRPLRKAQTVSLTGIGLGVDPDLMSLLASRKEKSASDDEDQKTPSSSRYKNYRQLVPVIVFRGCLSKKRLLQSELQDSIDTWMTFNRWGTLSEKVCEIPYIEKYKSYATSLSVSSDVYKYWAVCVIVQ